MCSTDGQYYTKYIDLFYGFYTSVVFVGAPVGCYQGGAWSVADRGIHLKVEHKYFLIFLFSSVVTYYVPTMKNNKNI